jgi:hypothetical protein
VVPPPPLFLINRHSLETISVFNCNFVVSNHKKIQLISSIFFHPHIPQLFSSFLLLVFMLESHFHVTHLKFLKSLWNSIHTFCILGTFNLLLFVETSKHDASKSNFLLACKKRQQLLKQSNTLLALLLWFQSFYINLFLKWSWE